MQFTFRLHTPKWALRIIGSRALRDYLIAAFSNNKLKYTKLNCIFFQWERFVHGLSSSINIKWLGSPLFELQLCHKLTWCFRQATPTSRMNLQYGTATFTYPTGCTFTTRYTWSARHTQKGYINAYYWCYKTTSIIILFWANVSHSV